MPRALTLDGTAESRDEGSAMHCKSGKADAFSGRPPCGTPRRSGCFVLWQAEKRRGGIFGSGVTPVILCVLNGSIIFCGHLMPRLKFSCELASIRLKSYEGTKSTGDVKEVIGLDIDLKGRTVIIVEDIVDTGATIESLVGQLKEKGAVDVRVCTFSLKTVVYKRNIKIDYMGMEIANKFIVGWGLDYDQMGRQLSDIYILKDQLE